MVFLNKIFFYWLLKFGDFFNLLDGHQIFRVDHYGVNIILEVKSKSLNHESLNKLSLRITIKIVIR